jgi:hypothetical protein
LRTNKDIPGMSRSCNCLQNCVRRSVITTHSPLSPESGEEPRGTLAPLVDSSKDRALWEALDVGWCASQRTMEPRGLRRPAAGQGRWRMVCNIESRRRNLRRSRWLRRAPYSVEVPTVVCVD